MRTFFVPFRCRSVFHAPSRRFSTAALPLEEALDLVKDAFAAAAERDIYTGDQVELVIVTRDGTRTEMLPLRKD